MIQSYVKKIILDQGLHEICHHFLMAWKVSALIRLRQFRLFALPPTLSFCSGSKEDAHLDEASVYVQPHGWRN